MPSQASSAAGAQMPTLASKDTIKVLVTGAAGQIAYSLIFMIARGHMFGPNKKVRALGSEGIVGIEGRTGDPPSPGYPTDGTSDAGASMSAS